MQTVIIDWHQYVQADPNILSGKPVVKGTRLSVDFILSLFAAGWTESQVLDSYSGLNREALQGVFAFAADSLRDARLYSFAG